MRLHLGVKSDPIENRYSFDWLFSLMRDHGAHRLQLGSSFPMWFAPDEYFTSLRRQAEKRGIRISSLFTSHRELGGFGSGDPLLEDATRRVWRRIIHIAALVGARSAGSNAAIVLRDQPHLRDAGMRCFFENMKPLLREARSAGLKALTIEPMSSIYELPSTPDEVRRIGEEMGSWHAAFPADTVPLLLCGDISHGVADSERRVLHDNWSLFEMEIPWMWEFHFKNTDAIFDATFGFDPEERARGMVDLSRPYTLIERNTARFPAAEVTGYLEIGGPKTGREYSDRRLERMLAESLDELVNVFHDKET
jgi:ribulose-phosphate 3-epimerase